MNDPLLSSIAINIIPKAMVIIVIKFDIEKNIYFRDSTNRFSN